MRLRLAALTAAVLVCFQTSAFIPRMLAASPDLVISQVYGGGGNAGALYTHDFIELFNRGSAPVSLNGMSLQYTSATGAGHFGAASNLITPLPNVTLAPGQYFLIQQAGGTVGSPLPPTDVVDPTPINMSGSDGKVALVNGTASLACNGGSTPCSPDALARIVDLVGYGSANFFEGSAAAPPRMACPPEAHRQPRAGQQGGRIAWRPSCWSPPGSPRS